LGQSNLIRLYHYWSCYFVIASVFIQRSYQARNVTIY